MGLHALFQQQADGRVHRHDSRRADRAEGEVLTRLLPLLLAWLWIGAAVAADTFPTLTGRVVDDAHVLSPATKAELETKFANLEARSTIQLVVATVPSLGGQEIEPYANALFRAWRLGTAQKNNGVLLLVAPNEHRVRIEVGYGLEGTLTDAVSSVIIANAAAPRFKAGDFDGGVTRASDDIVTTLTSDASEWRGKADFQKAPAARAQDNDATVPVLIFLFILFVCVSIVRRSQRHGGRWFVPIDTGQRSGGGFSIGLGGGFSGGGGSSGGGGASGGW